jgi:hypothetical protein
MASLRDRLVMTEGRASVRSTGASVAEVTGPLDAGVLPAKLTGAGGTAVADLLAALGYRALGGDDSLGPALVQQKPQNPRLAAALSEPAWVAVFPGASHPIRLALAAGLLQIHDFWDASHEAAQRADDLGERSFSPYWHGITHRREPDASNAAYWFRRVGRHPIFGPLAAAARPLLDQHCDTALAGRLIPAAAWNAGAMIDLCAEARPGTPVETLARRIQRLEMWLLLDATCAAILPPSSS